MFLGQFVLLLFSSLNTQLLYLIYRISLSLFLFFFESIKKTNKNTREMCTPRTLLLRLLLWWALPAAPTYPQNVQIFFFIKCSLLLPHHPFDCFNNIPCVVCMYALISFITEKKSSPSVLR